MRLRAGVASVGLAAIAGCSDRTAPARDQWKVYLGTDAPVPQLGQQLFVEFIDANGVDLAPVETRLIDGSRAELWPVSFGVLPSQVSEVPRIRVRLYRLDATGPDGAPLGTALIDETALLPPVGSGVNEVAMTLPMACFGVPPDLSGHMTCDPSRGALAQEPTLAAMAKDRPLPAPGSWPPATVVPCSSTPPDGMVCVPGGAFLLGAAQYFPTSPDTDPTPEHLVQIAPFAIDVDEVTVGTIQGLVQSGALTAPLSDDPDSTAQPPECTYGSGNPALPVTCISWKQANDACTHLNKRLPKEAEWEYVAGNVGLKTPYPWGSDTNVCANAVVARGRTLGVSLPEASECLSAQSGYMPGPVAGGLAADTTALGVLNLGGNVSEWVADVFDAYSAPCWNGSMLLVNPVCGTAANGSTAHGFRGGSWQTAAFEAFTYERDFSLDATDPGGVGIGFRCAVDM